MSGRAKIHCLYFWSLFLILDFFVTQPMANERFNSPIRPPLWRKNKVLLSRLLNRTSIIGPRHDLTDPVTINVHLQLQQIAEVDFNTQQMVFSAWLYQSWRDDSLKWTRLEYAPRFLRLKSTDIWVPDVGFVNTAENEQNLKSTTILPVRVNWQGIVSWQQPVLISTLCRMDVSYFPYDTQTCSLLMMSFRKHGGLINLCHIQDVVGMRLVFRQIHDHPEWNLIHSKTLREVVHINLRNHSRLHFVFSFQRRALFYECSLLMPLYIITVMALFSFTLPNACGEKICFAITILLSLVLNLSLISQFVPNSSDNFPVIGLFFLSAIILVGLSVILNVVILLIHSSAMEPMPIPQFVWKTVVGCMCMLTLKSERSYMRKMHENNFRSARCLKQLASYITILTTNRATKNHSSQHTNTDFSDPTEDNLGEGSMQYLSPSVQNFIHNILRAMEATLCDFLTKTREEAVREVTKVQWMILADILDRLFSILFIVITALFALYFRFNVHFRSHQHLQNLKELYDGMEDHAC